MYAFALEELARLLVRERRGETNRLALPRRLRSHGSRNARPDVGAGAIVRFLRAQFPRR